MENFKSRAAELVKKLNQASEAYYNGKEEIMSNYEWDAMFDELSRLEAETGYVLPDCRSGRRKNQSGYHGNWMG